MNYISLNINYYTTLLTTSKKSLFIIDSKNKYLSIMAVSKNILFTISVRIMIIIPLDNIHHNSCSNTTE